MVIKPIIKTFGFLALLTLLDFMLRKGFIGFMLPFSLPHNLNILVLYTVFSIAALLCTHWFSRADQRNLKAMGVSFNKRNRVDFYIGLAIGTLLWGIVSLSQSFIAGFSWVLRTDISPSSLLYGLLFIFIADLGTELYMRAYPLSQLKSRLGPKVAIIIMVLFEVLKGFLFSMHDGFNFYAVMIPVLHVIFFSILYFKTKRLGASLGVHTGANFITISIFDLRVEQAGQAIPAGVFQANKNIESLSMHSLQLPWVLMAILFSIGSYIWWKKTTKESD